LPKRNVGALDIDGRRSAHRDFPERIQSIRTLAFVFGCAGRGIPFQCGPFASLAELSADTADRMAGITSPMAVRRTMRIRGERGATISVFAAGEGVAFILSSVTDAVLPGGSNCSPLARTRGRRFSLRIAAKTTLRRIYPRRL
jgi:hypothetical protein